MTSQVEPKKIVVKGTWHIPAERRRVYSIVSDFERLPERFPKLARSMKILHRHGNRLTMDAEAASFGRFFPSVKIRINAELLPGSGYRCITHNLTFNTTGEEELLLKDDPGGTTIQYSYFVTVRWRILRPVYAWLVKTLGLPYWKRGYIDPLIALVSQNTDVPAGADTNKRIPGSG